MKFDTRMTELIAVGASVAANCQACVTYHIAKALESGVEQDEIAQAVEVGRMVRKGAAAKADQVVESRLPAAPPAPQPPQTDCGRAGATN
jgi:AhpD family alkylhydroperoxidase